VAERHSRGRGRLDRRWRSSVAGNLYASLVLKAAAGSAGLPAVTLYMAVVLSRVVSRLGVEPSIKWPNDLLLAGRKVAGILAEGVVAQGGLAGAVLGTGVNLAMSASDLAEIDQPAASLNLALGRPVDREEFLALLLDEFFSRYDSFAQSGFPLIRSEYLALTPFLGKPIAVDSLGSRISGTASDVTESGSLVVLTPQGRIEITVGDLQ
jgi:BirA family biotin operon repressor/biotin-[acetyl-CoA-carboxylase] ligase